MGDFWSVFVANTAFWGSLGVFAVHFWRSCKFLADFLHFGGVLEGFDGVFEGFGGCFEDVYCIFDGFLLL